MSGFSSNEEVTINKNVDIEYRPVPCNYDELVNNYNLRLCKEWINKNLFSKVCLQFPDSLLVDSVAVALWLEKNIDQKLYILGDTSYGSCCVDEVAAEHVNADSIIHFGHACLSPTTRLPLLYIFPKFLISIPHFINEMKTFCQINKEPILLLYDVEYEHCIGDIRNLLENEQGNIIISELCTSQNNQLQCCQKCNLLKGQSQHEVLKLGRAFCNSDGFKNVVYIAKKDSRTLENFIMSLRNKNIFVYYGKSFIQVQANKNIRRRLYLSERVKDAQIIGILIATLGIKQYLEAVKTIRTLATRKGKKCYIISVGKPSVAKLANFPEVEVFVRVSCPEAELEDERQYLQPIVSLMEAELALNESRQWDEIISSDFRELLEGGDNFVPLPDKVDIGDPDVSLLTNRIRNSANENGPDDEGNLNLAVKPDLPVSLKGLNFVDRTWQGLDLALGQTPVVKATMGRSGIAQGYNGEINYDSAENSN
uniref:2-(3-amino-3-carboxypropyl)histidine synthase subunit 2 n=1 Tax=Clastoptera arizonana TaxID=38151 RepID=A0A1B6CJ12_9HEMI